MKSKIHKWGLLIASSYGCTYGATSEEHAPNSLHHEDSLSTRSNVEAVGTNLPVADTSTEHSPEQIFTDFEGRRWIARQAQRNNDETIHHPVAKRRKTDLDSMTDDEVADFVRPIRLVGDTEYTAVTVDVAAVRLARKKDRAGIGMRTSINEPGRAVELTNSSTPPGLEPTFPPSIDGGSPEATPISGFVGSNAGLDAFRNQPVDYDDLFLHSRSRRTLSRFAETPASKFLRARAPVAPVGESINTPYTQIGSDDRSWVPNAYVYPQSTTVATAGPLTVPFSGVGNCTLTMIGRHTAVGAAHCVHDGPGGTWKSVRSWVVGYSSTQRTTVPYTISEAWVFGAYTGCYWVTVSNGWKTTGADSEDYAVWDFSAPGTCGLRPGDVSGFVPVGIATVPAWDHAFAVNSILSWHDGTPYPPQPTGVNWEFRDPNMITRSIGLGGVGLDPTDSNLLIHYMDTQPGSSGGGMIQDVHLARYGDPTLYWVGDNIFQAPGANYARRSDWVVWSNISAWTTEW